MIDLKNQRQKRKRRISTKIRGTSNRPRLSIFRSNKHFFVQLIDDSKQKTILGMSDKSLEPKENETAVSRARRFGEVFASKAKEKKVNTVVFDKGMYAYHGRIKAVADGTREGGLQF